MYPTKLFNIFFAVSLLSLGISSCQPNSPSGNQNNTKSSATSQPAKTLKVYTYRSSVEDKDMKERFANLAEVAPQYTVMDSKEIVDQMVEGTITPDVLIVDDLASILTAREAGVLQPFSTAGIEENVPFKYKDKDGYWVALGKSGIAVIFHKDRVQEADIKTYADLTKPKFKGKILLADAEESINRQLLAGMIAGEGERAATRFAKGVVANLAQPPVADQTAVIEGVANGDGDLGIVDIAALMRYRYSGNPDAFEAAKNLSLVYPATEQGITYLTFKFLAIPKNTADRARAVRFAEYLTNESAQQAMSAGGFLFPTNPMVLPADFLIDEGGYRDMGTDLNEIGQLDSTAISIAQAAGWE